MMYSYRTLDDGTCFAYSNLLDDQTVRIAVERPADGGFDDATCFLPAMHWYPVHGFSELELRRFESVLADDMDRLYRLAAEAAEPFSAKEQL